MTTLTITTTLLLLALSIHPGKQQGQKCNLPEFISSAVSCLPANLFKNNQKLVKMFPKQNQSRVYRPQVGMVRDHLEASPTT